MLLFRSGRSANWSWTAPFLSVLFLSILFSAHEVFAEKAKGKGGKKKQALSTASPGEESLTNIPLPIGHEAKGLTLPDFDSDGHLRGKFEAATARRIDQEHVLFSVLKITTYTPESKTDLTIEMSESVFDLKTRILSSKNRTTVTREDFNIVGDSVEFDTNTRTGKLTGNVKMVITDQSKFKPQATK
ncbi:MAG TPA: hypothetical protein VEI58_04305 [Chthoniobacterales bacterium]|nr:hypothetical protein [Chthoniobacterales bacterium]